MALSVSLMPLLSWDAPVPRSPVCTRLSLPPYRQHRHPILLSHCSSIASARLLFGCSQPPAIPSTFQSLLLPVLMDSSQTLPAHSPGPSDKTADITSWPAVPFVGCTVSTQLSNYCLFAYSSPSSPEEKLLKGWTLCHSQLYPSWPADHGRSLRSS